MLLTCLSIGIFLEVAVASIKEDGSYWRSNAEKELEEALSYQWNTNKAKNIIVFVGDGMSPDTITASRIYRAGEKSHLAWERFPHVGVLKTYNVQKFTPDSASAATALFSGVKSNHETVGVDANVPLGDCEISLNPKYHTSSIIEWAQAAGKATGFVTTTRVTHATPGPLYAHCPNRKWECESVMPKSASRCKDIARQLIEDEPGKNIRVIMGGGRQVLQSNVSSKDFDPIDTWACYSRDGRDLITDYSRDKASRNLPFKVVQNNEELSQVDTNEVDYLLGIFANGHISMEWERNKGPKGQPSLEDMTRTALKILQKSKNGYLLVVEGGLIDFAHHRGHAAQALLETVRFSDAINATMQMINTDDTLVIVTSDHTHSMIFNGYSDRGSSILGIATKSKIDGTPYTTLTYSTGGPNNEAYEIGEDHKVKRIDPSKVNTTQFNYSQQAGIITDESHHGGGDVTVHAIGPLAHLIHTVHEQNYIAFVVAYAAKIGPYGEKNYTNGVEQHNTNLNYIVVSCLSGLSMYFICKMYHRDV